MSLFHTDLLFITKRVFSLVLNHNLHGENMNSVKKVGLPIAAFIKMAFFPYVKHFPSHNLEVDRHFPLYIATNGGK